MSSNLLGHSIGAQVLASLSSPWHERPPLAGSGLSQVRVWNWLPIPHETLPLGPTWPQRPHTMKLWVNEEQIWVPVDYVLLTTPQCNYTVRDFLCQWNLFVIDFNVIRKHIHTMFVFIRYLCFANIIYVFMFLNVPRKVYLKNSRSHIKYLETYLEQLAQLVPKLIQGDLWPCKCKHPNPAVV